MPFIIQLLFIVFAVSMDGFTVGISYGLRNISITVITLTIIVTCSGIVVFCSMTFGSMINRIVQPEITTYIGGLIFISLGLFLFFSQLFAKRSEKQETARSYSDMINNPTMFDIDKSGTISVKEALLLGIALALDAFGAGFAAGLLEFSTIATTLLIALASGVFVYSGFLFGHLLAKIKWLQRLAYIPPLLLILLGLSSF